MWGGLRKDVGLSRRGGRQSHRVIHVGALTIHWCSFSLVGLRHRRGGGLQQYLQPEVITGGNWGTRFTSCSFKNPCLQGFSHPLTQVEVSWAQTELLSPSGIPRGIASPQERVSELSSHQCSRCSWCMVLSRPSRSGRLCL